MYSTSQYGGQDEDDERQQSPSSTKPDRTKRQNVSVACNACRTARRKCEGKVPCRPCLNQNIECVVEENHDKRRSAHRQSKARNHQPALELLQLLQNESVEGAQEILSKIRTGAAVEDILAESSAQIQGVVSPQALEKITIPGAAISGDALAFMHENPLSPTLVSAIKSCLPGIHAWREAVSFMLQVTGIVFPALSQARIQQLLNAAHQEQTQSRAGLDEICALAAASSQYSRGGISETVGTIMYSVAKLYLDDVIQVDRIAAVRVCIFLVLYNAVHRADVAFADTEYGLAISRGVLQRSGTALPEARQECGTLVQILLTYRSWLAAALGYVVADEHLTNWTGVVDGVDGVPGLAGV